MPGTMHPLLNGYYGVSADEFATLATSATIVLDANVLLDFYRVADQTRAELFSLLEWAQGRLWVPFTVALEFQRNRSAVRMEPIDLLENARQSLTSAFGTVNATLDKITPRDSRESLRSALQSVETVSASFFDAIEATAKLNSPGSDDRVRSQLDELLRGQVADPLSASDVADATQEAQKRYAEGVPPGFRDASKKDLCRLGDLAYEAQYGDFLLWYELRKHAKINAIKQIIMLTRDRKEDWWLRVRGKTVGPRPELAAELQTSSGVERFVLFELKNFLSLVREAGLFTVAAQTVEDVADLLPRQTGRQTIDRAYEVVEAWLRQMAVDFRFNDFDGPAFEVSLGDGALIGIEVKIATGGLRAITLATSGISRWLARFRHVVLLYVLNSVNDIPSRLEPHILEACAQFSGRLTIAFAETVVSQEGTPALDICAQYGPDLTHVGIVTQRNVIPS